MLRAVLVLAVAAAFASPAGAAAQWSAPVSLTGDARFVFRPQVAFAGAGDAVVAYGVGIERGSVLGLARARPGQDAAFAATQTTTTDPATRVLTYAGSRLLVVSQTQRGLPFELRARFGSLDAGLGAVRRLAPGEDVLRYSPAVDARGDAAVAYVQNVRRGPVVRKRVVRVVRRPAGGSFARPVTVAGRASPTAVGAAVGPRGEIVVAYERGGRLEVRRRVPGHVWTPPQILGAAAEGHTQIDVAAGGDGSFAVGWFAQELTEGGSNGPAAVRLAVRSAGGRSFHTARALETFAERAPQGAAVHVALAPDGTGVAGWTGRQDGRFVARAADLGARVGRAHAGGARAQVDVASRVGQTVSDPAADAVLGGAAASAGGAAVAVWSPPLDTPSPQVFAAVRAAAGSDFGPPETVSPPYREVATPTVGLDPRTGEALAAWVARTGERTQAVLAALRPPP